MTKNKHILMEGLPFTGSDNSSVDLEMLFRANIGSGEVGLAFFVQACFFCGVGNEIMKWKDSRK